MASFYFFLHISALICLAFSSLSCAQKHRNISLGSFLTPLGPQTSWLSPSDDFAFGFRPLETDSSSFLLAIWFQKIESKTVVWYAIADSKPVIMKAGSGGRVELTTAGELILRNQAGILWSANAASNASYAAMLDTGNFIIVGADVAPRWESFQDPRDTMLPYQVLSQGTELRSRLLDTDYSGGRFKLSMQGDGNLVLYAVSVPSGYQHAPYWATNTVGNGSQLIFNQSGTLNLVLINNNEISIISAAINPVGDFYQRATMDPDGVFRKYVRPKNISRTVGWQDEWTSVAFQPPDICDHSIEDGSGICGINSCCQSGGNSSVDCECLPQYSFFDHDRKYEGCKPDFATQSCEADELEAGRLFDFQTLTGFNWPFSDYEVYSSIDENQCRKECLTDCFCAVAIFTVDSGTCRKMKLPLSNGAVSGSAGTRALVKVPRTNSTSQPSSSTSVEETWTTMILDGSLQLDIRLRWSR